MKLYPIGELAEPLGVAGVTLRRWHAAGMTCSRCDRTSLSGQKRGFPAHSDKPLTHCALPHLPPSPLRHGPALGRGETTSSSGH